MEDSFLFLDSSSTYSVIALKKGEIFDLEMSKGHSIKENLLQEIHQILTKNKIIIEEISAFYTSIGPGSFTAIRISLSIMKTFSFVHQKPLYTFSTLDHFSYKQKSNLCFLKAPGKKIYIRAYFDSIPLISPKEYLLKDIPYLIDKFKVSHITYEDAIDLEEKISSVSYHPFFTNKKKLEDFLCHYPIEKQSSKEDLFNLSPLYIRKSQAEENQLIRSSNKNR